MKRLHNIAWFRTWYLGDRVTDTHAYRVVHKYGVPYIRVGRLMLFDEDRVALWARAREHGSIEPKEVSAVT